MYPKNPAKFSECVLDLTALEVGTRSVDNTCLVHQFPRCEKLVSLLVLGLSKLSKTIPLA